MRAFCLLIILSLGTGLYAQELITNGSFELVDPTCFYSQCESNITNCVNNWQTAVGNPVVGNDPCFNCEGSVNSPYGSKTVKLDPKTNSIPFNVDGDGIYQAMTIYPGQVLDISYAVHAYCSDWGLQSLSFLALESLPSNIGDFSNLDLSGVNYMHIDSKDIINFVPGTNNGFAPYVFTLDLDNPISVSSPAGKPYNYFMILAKEKFSNPGPNEIILDNISLQQCTSLEFFSLDYEIEQSGPDCGYTEFNISSEAPIRYAAWDFGDGTCTSSEIGFTNHIYNTAGTYIVNVTIVDVNGCIKNMQEVVEITCDRCPGFSVDFTWTIDPMSYNPIVYIDPLTGQQVFQGCEWDYIFTDLSTPTTGNTIVAWEWDFGAGNVYYTTSPTVPLFSNNSFNGLDHEVCLTVTDSYGCSETHCKIITVNCRTSSNPIDGEYKVEDRSLDEDVKNLTLEVRPNPFLDQLLVNYPSELTSIELFNATGQLIRSEAGSFLNQITIMTGDLTAGIYYLRAIDLNGQIHTEKVVKY